MALEPGQMLAHYKLVAQIGEGGMGVVWSANDTRLGRDVAIKVLPETFADDPKRVARFDREAKAVASLNHPNIVTIYSVEQAEGQRFITMELVRGRSLADLIPADGFGLSRFFELALLAGVADHYLDRSRCRAFDEQTAALHQQWHADPLAQDLR